METRDSSGEEHMDSTTVEEVSASTTETPLTTELPKIEQQNNLEEEEEEQEEQEEEHNEHNEHDEYNGSNIIQDNDYNNDNNDSDLLQEETTNNNLDELLITTSKSIGSDHSITNTSTTPTTTTTTTTTKTTKITTNANPNTPSSSSTAPLRNTLKISSMILDANNPSVSAASSSSSSSSHRSGSGTGTGTGAGHKTSSTPQTQNPKAHRRATSEQGVSVSDVMGFGTNFSGTAAESRNTKQGVTDRERKMQIQVRNLEARLADREKTLKTLTIENRQMTRRLSELEQKTNERTKTMYDERQRRIKANQEKIEIREKLLKVQKMVNARLKILGIDLSTSDNMAEALDAALQAIQKLTVQLNEKEETITVWEKEREQMKTQYEQQSFQLQKMQETLEPIKEDNTGLKKQLKEATANCKEMSIKMEAFMQEKTQLTNELKNVETMLNKTSGADKQIINRLNEKLEESSKKFEEQKQTITQLNKQVEELKEGMSEQKLICQKQITELESKTTSFTTQKLKLEESVEKHEKKCNEQQKTIQELIQNADQMQLQFSSSKVEYENKIENMLDTVESLKKTKLQLENKVAELEDHYTNHKGEISNLNKELEKMKAENEQLKAQLTSRNDRIDEMTKNMRDMEETLKIKKMKIEELSEEKTKIHTTMQEKEKEFINEKTQLEAQIDNWKQQNNKLSTSMLKLEEKNEKKEEKIKQLQLEAEKLQTEMVQEKQKSDTNFEALKLESEKITQSKTQEIENLSSQCKTTQLQLESIKEQLQQANERWQELINRPRSDKEVQTTMTGTDMKDACIENPRLKEQVKELQNKLIQVETIIEELSTENKQLITDMDDLIKKAAKFMPDSSTHKGEVLAMAASPTRYIVATSATDKTVRLWQIHVDAMESNENNVSFTPKLEVSLPTDEDMSVADKKKKPSIKVCEPYARSTVDSKVHALCFSPCGKFLAAGTNYCDSPDGYVVIWGVNNDNFEGYVIHAFRSRPTVRFAGVRALCFGTDGRGGSARYSHLLFAGDVNGAIWCFNTDNEQLIGKIQHHKDVIYGIGCGDNGWLYSVSHDQHMYAFDLSSIDCDIESMFNAVIPINEVMRDILNNSDTPTAGGSKTHARNKSQGSRPPPRRASLRETPKPKMIGKQPARHNRGKSRDSTEMKRDETECGGLPQYKGESVAEDTQYPFWWVAVSSDGAYVVTGNRRLRVFKAKSPQEGSELAEPIRFTDTDTEHIKVIDCKNGLVLVTRKQVPRCKIFDICSGKEVHKFTCKEKDGGYTFAAFLCDRKHIVAITQLISKEPSPPSMRLYSYA